MVEISMSFSVFLDKIIRYKRVPTQNIVLQHQIMRNDNT